MRPAATHLHDELDGTNEEAKELQDEIFLLLLHLIETVLLATLQHFSRGQTIARRCLEKLFGHGSCAAGCGLFLFLLDGVVLRLELLDQRVHVLVLLLVLLDDAALWRIVFLLLVQLARRDVSAQVVVGSGCVRHGDSGTRIPARRARISSVFC